MYHWKLRFRKMPNRRLRKEIAEAARGLHELGVLDGKAMREFEFPSDEGPRVVQAPAPTASTLLPSNRVVSVILQPEEEVAWVWTSTPDGGSYVSGYTIVKRK